VTRRLGVMAGGLAGLAQKASELARYRLQRGAMLLQYHWRRLEYRRLFPQPPSRILVIRLASIGDVVRATAIIERLHAEYPGAALDFLTTQAALPVIERHPALRTVYTLERLAELPAYDWVVNLQTRDVPEGFLRSAGRSYGDVLRHVASQVRPRLQSGRRFDGSREQVSTNILYCRSEMEELFLIALLKFDPERYPVTRVSAGPAVHAAVRLKFPWPDDRPAVGVFLGSNSIGCGADEGFRTYSLEYLEHLIVQLAGRFTVVVIGQSQVRNAEERARYRQIVARHQHVVDLVDKTSLEELIAVMDRLSLLISTDSSPVHLALASRVPVVGLYVSDGSFRMSPRMQQESFVAINSRPPCFYYSWRWRFFCASCGDVDTRAKYCSSPVMAFGVDRIPLRVIEDAADQLLAGSGAIAAHPPTLRAS
jgi:ADP-heptose:LPS heptosyltransferase